MNQSIKLNNADTATQYSEILSTKLGRKYRKQILVSVSLIGILVSCVYATLLWTQYHMALSSVTDFLYSFAYATTFYWIKHERLAFAAYWLVFIASLQVTFGSIFFVGADTGFQLYFLTLPVVVYVLLNDQARWKKAGIMLYGGLCFIASHTLRVETYMAPIPSELAELIFIANTLIVFSIVILAVKLFSNEIENAYQQQSKLVLTDSLTGLANHQFVAQYASKLLSQADRYGHPVSLIRFDINHFSQINHEHGHSAGDKCLKHIAKLVNDHIRDADILARIGGDEFIIILPETLKDESEELIRRLQQLIRQQSLNINGTAVQLSASFGASHCDSSAMKTINELIDDANSKRLLAKEKQTRDPHTF